MTLMEDKDASDFSTSVIGPRAVFALIGSLCDPCILWLIAEMPGAKVNPVRHSTAEGRVTELILPQKAPEESGGDGG